LIPSSIPGQGLVLPDGNPPKRYLNEPEQVQYYFGSFMKVYNPQGQSSVDIPADKVMDSILDEKIGQARSSQISDAQIIRTFTDPNIQKLLGATPQQITNALNRNKVTPQTAEPEPEKKPLTKEEKQKGSIFKEDVEVEKKRTEEKDINYLKKQIKSTESNIESLKEKMTRYSDKSPLRPKPELLQKQEEKLKDLKQRLEYSESQTRGEGKKSRIKGEDVTPSDEYFNYLNRQKEENRKKKFGNPARGLLGQQGRQ
jgi:hypothetical protein